VFEDTAMPDELAQQIHASDKSQLGNCRVTAMAPDAETLQNIQKMFERGTSTFKQYQVRANPQHVVNIKLENKSSNFVAYGVAAETTLALKLAAGVLGNGFAGRLMQQVRDKCGLTYGIYANANDQLFYVQATFAPRLMDRGIAEMKKVMKEWKNGVTQEELDVQKKMMINSRRVAFDDPVKMADVLHLEHLRGETYHAEAINAVTLQEVNDAIQALGTCTLVKAGTF
jgi:predicted Zn-dependent peptidase